MSNTYMVGGYHGKLPHPFRAKLESFCKKTEIDNQYVFEGTLDDFAECWNDKFLYVPALNTIWVTQYSTFGQR